MPMTRSKWAGRRPEALAATLLSVGIGLALIAASSEMTSAGRAASSPPLTPCHLDRLAEEVQCGVHEVYEARQSKTGRRLGIQFAVLPSLRRTKEADPLFILAGGPGQGARSFAAIAARYFKKVRRSREIVLVDLRGTGGSNPLLCPTSEAEFASLTSLLGDQDTAARCLKALDADPRHYTHADALADLDEIRLRLGYSRINLWGGSWGTRAALLYAATFPDAVRTVVLDGAVPLDMSFPRSLATDTESAMELLFEGCAEDPDCAAAFPSARADFSRLLESLDRKPVVAAVRHPQTGAAVRITLNRASLTEIVRVALYTPADAARILQMLWHANAGDYLPLIAQVVRSASQSTDTMALGATISILCSEDMPAVSGVDFDLEGRGTFLRSNYADAWRARCKGWPTGPGLTLDPHLKLTTPALVLSGIHDPVTPPRWGEAMGRHFPNHLHVVVPGAAHNASFSGCIPDLIAEFISKGGGGGQDVSCAKAFAWPPFVVSDAGSRP